MSRVSRWKYTGSKLKEAMLKGLIDVENKCKVSDREFLRTKSHELTLDGKEVFTGIWTYWTKHPSIINAEPMKGCRVNELTAYKFAIKNGYWTEEEVPENVFTKDTQKIKNKVDEKTLMRLIEMEILGHTQSEALPLDVRKEFLEIVCDDPKEYEKIYNKNKKELLKR